LFVEVDRSQDVEENSEESEVSLYPLNLVNTYNILDQQYELFATVNLNLDYTEGGHYTVNKFVGEDEIIAIHEDNIQRRTLWPTFDHGVILVLLRKLHSPPVETETYQDSSEVNEAAERSPSCNSESQSPVQDDQSDQQTPVFDDLDGCSGDQDVSSLGRKEFRINAKYQLQGDNLKLYLGEDKALVQKYRERFIEKEEQKIKAATSIVEDVSLKGLGGKVLESKIYRIQSLSGSKKRRKKFSKLQASLIDNDIKETCEENTNVLGLDIPEEVGSLKESFLVLSSSQNT